MVDQQKGEPQQWRVAEPYLNLHCQLGEGPYYEQTTNTLRFVDIKGKQIHTVSLSEGPDSVKTVQLDVPVTVTADVEGVDPREKILVGLKYGIALLDRATGRYKYLTKFAASDDNARLRSNDGAVDPHGRFWLGTMTDFGLGDFKPEGKLRTKNIFALWPPTTRGRTSVCILRGRPATHPLVERYMYPRCQQPWSCPAAKMRCPAQSCYFPIPSPSLSLSTNMRERGNAGSMFRFDLGKSREEARAGLTIPNSLGWSPDGRTMYFTHSSARQVLAFDYDPTAGGLSNERVLYQHDGPGEPDGFRVDVQGNLWQAIWGESRILKISPRGEVVGQVCLPTKHITCCEFVGTELFVTSAADEEGEGQSKALGGALFRVDVGVEGLEHFKFKFAA